MRRFRSKHVRGALDGAGRLTLMSDTMLILASCTERKRLPIPKELRLRTVRHRDVAERAARWWQRLMHHRSDTLPAARRSLRDISKSDGSEPQFFGNGQTFPLGAAREY